MSTPKCLLVIDDEDPIREIVKACLEDIGGWQALTASRGQQGLDLARSRPVDAILLDISMPDLDGYQIYQQLQHHPQTQTIPVILLTARVLPEDRCRFQQMGVAGTIIKPFNPIEICNQIASLLQW